MTATPNTAPQLTTPEGELSGMVAPGQENILEEFVREQEAQEPELLLGKFKSQEDLAKAYQELEKKLGQPKQEPTQQEPLQTGYTAEQAAEVYGREAVEALGEQGLDLAEIMWQADNGQDISQHYDTLAETFKVPRQVVENYVSKAQVPPAAAAEAPQLSEQDAAQLKAMVGGDQGFADLSNWAKANLQADELANYNAVVDSGNKAAIEWAIKAMVARRAAPDAVVEPKLYGGGEPAPPKRFESQQQVLDAMNKRNERGQRLYDVDEAYRAKITQLLAVSDVF